MANVLIEIVITASLVDKLSIGQSVEILKVLLSCHVFWIVAIMTQKDIFVSESRDEVRAVESGGCVCHAFSMAQNRWKVKRWWTVCETTQFRHTECCRLSSCLALAAGSERRNQHHATRQRAQRTIGVCRWFV